MKKYYLFAAFAAVALASCTDDDFIGDVGVTNPLVPQEAPILFTSNQQAFTRADFTGAEAAKKLGNKFVVFGYKGTTTGTPGSTVFDNYLVKYQENTANTTESNSANWEYVLPNVKTGETYQYVPITHATNHGITQQTIKYWDYSQPQYDFFAWSTGSKTAIYTGTTIAEGQVLVTEMKATKATGENATGLANAYTFTGKAADLAECYISDLVTVNKAGTAGIGEVTGYNEPVKLTFRQLGTKVRIGIYETVPGYSVKDVKFYSEAANALLDENDENNGTANATANASAKIFTTQANEIYTEGTYTVYFPTVDKPTDADNNQAHITFAPKDNTTQSTTVDWGALNYTIRESGESSADHIYLGRTSNTASFAGAAKDNYYVVYLPNQTGTNLNLRVNYKLESIDGSKETIEVKGATAQVPLIYTQWKPGYAYTYLFKISDKTNGYTGLYDPLNPDGNTYNANPAGLYPITFDAVVVNAEEDATQETITTISTPSITSYQKGSTVVNKNEYLASTGDIFVTVNDGTPGTASYTAVGNGKTLTAGKVYYTSNSGDGAFIAAGTEASNGSNYYEATAPDNTTLSTGILQILTDKADLYKIPAGMTEAEVIDALSYYYTKAEYIAANPQPTSEDITSYYTFNGVTYTAATAYDSETTYYTKVEPVYNAASPNSDNFDENTYYTNDGSNYSKATTFDTNTTYYTKAITSFTTTGRSNKELIGATYSLVDQVVFGADGNVISVGADQALRFTPEAGKTYAFVYTKTKGTDSKIYKAKSFVYEDDPNTQAVETAQSVKGYYRYALVSAVPQGGSATDVQEGTIYFGKNDATEGMITPFLGQTVNNLYRDNQGNTIASGYAETGKDYYFTNNNGQSYEKAHNVDYVDKNVLPTGLYELKNGDYVLTNDKTLGYEAVTLTAGTALVGYYSYDETEKEYALLATGEAPEGGETYYQPVTGKAYYYKDETGTTPVYRLCVFLPQQTTGLFVIKGTDTTVEGNVVACADNAVAVKGMTYFDKYTKNTGVRYAKVIKVE